MTETNPNYWDCECDTHYMHKQLGGKGFCCSCGAYEDDMSDSIESEVTAENMAHTQAFRLETVLPQHYVVLLIKEKYCASSEHARNLLIQRTAPNLELTGVLPTIVSIGACKNYLRYKLTLPTRTDPDQTVQVKLERNDKYPEPIGAEHN